MKFAFCLFHYFPFGGLQRDFSRIAAETVARGHEIHVYTMAWQGEFPKYLTVKIIAAAGLSNHRRIAAFIKETQRKLNEQTYDLVVGFNKMPGLDIYYAADSCFSAKAADSHGCWYRLTPRYRTYQAFEHAVFAKTSSTEVLLLAEAEKKRYKQAYQTPEARLHLLPPGIAKDRLPSSDAAAVRKQLRESLGLHTEDILLLMIGSGFKTKGVDRSLRAFAALPANLQKQARLFIIGDDKSKVFALLAKKLGILAQVQFLGGRDDVPRFLLAADILLHPAYRENTGTVLLEAVVAGLPVLASEICGYSHYVKQAKAGLIVAEPFQQQVFNELLSVLFDPAQRAVFRQNGLLYGQSADLFSLPQKAVDFIEKTAMEKQHQGK